MTVLDTTQPFSQYTGTGQRVYFEYGFYWNGGPVVVYVNNSLVSFTYQANGVVLIEAPALNDVIVIRRMTDITQERNWVPFDEFQGAWTEAACDKLILLKQEALGGRLDTNLNAIQQLDRTIIDNSQGTNADVFLWNYDQSGVFSGEVTTQMPEIGTVVAKPWDFAYFQHGGDPSAFRDYEVVYLMNKSYSIIPIGVDYIGKTWTEFARAYVGGEEGIEIDQTSTFLFRLGSSGNMRQFVWRGNCFTTVLSQAHAGSNSPEDIVTLSGIQQFVTFAEEAFGHGLRVYDYEITEPFAFATAYTRTATADNWNGGFDLRFGNNDMPEKGDALVCSPQNGNNITTYQVSGGVLTLVDQFAANSQGNKAVWSCDRDSGIMTSHSTAAPNFRAYQIDMSDLTIGNIDGLVSPDLSPTQHAVLAAAAVPDETDMFITCEDTGTSNDAVRTYRHDGANGLTQLDSHSLSGSGNTSLHFRISPYTKRIWLIGISHVEAFEVDSAGLITPLISLPYGVASTGANDNFIAFAENADGLYITTNGYTGIKQKLYECWEMNETGSVTRVGSMGNMDLPVYIGPVSNRTGVIGNAADFTGATVLQRTLATDDSELRTQGTFSIVCDVILDSLTNEQRIMTRGRNDAWVDLSANDFSMYYNADTFAFQIRVGGTAYTAIAPIPGGASTGVYYHLYFEYDKANDTVGCRLDSETIVTAALPAGSSINVYGADSRLTVGRFTSRSGQQRYLDGGVDQLYWFWDKLTEAEQDWMYNSGNSRAFSEL